MPEMPNQKTVPGEQIPSKVTPPKTNECPLKVGQFQ